MKKNISTFFRFIRQRLSIHEFNANKNIHPGILTCSRLSTIASTIDVCQSTSKFEFVREKRERQQRQLQEWRDAIQPDNIYMIGGARLYATDLTDLDWKSVKENFVQKSKEKIVELWPLLKLKKITPNQKKLQLFIYNTVRVEVKQLRKQPVGEGGSSLIYVARASINFLDSTDFNCYLKRQEPIERILAIKRLKPELHEKLHEKLAHEKNIVQKLKGSCCIFLPNYYGTESNTEFSNSLLMEYLVGEELANFAQSKSETFSLWTKIFILLSVIHGIRHLIGYDIVHLDLKPSNIIVCQHLLTKIIDFGEAYHPQTSKANYLPGFTFPYAAPEIFSKSASDAKVDLTFSQMQDVYAFGLIMAELLFGSQFFQFGKNKFHNIYSLREQLRYVFMAGERVQEYGQEQNMYILLFLIMRCLDPDPKRRPKFDWVGLALKLILNQHIN